MRLIVFSRHFGGLSGFLHRQNIKRTLRVGGEWHRRCKVPFQNANQELQFGTKHLVDRVPMSANDLCCCLWLIWMRPGIVNERMNVFEQDRREIFRTEIPYQQCHQGFDFTFATNLWECLRCQELWRHPGNTGNPEIQGQEPPDHLLVARGGGVSPLVIAQESSYEPGKLFQKMLYKNENKLSFSEW